MCIGQLKYPVANDADREPDAFYVAETLRAAWPRFMTLVDGTPTVPTSSAIDDALGEVTSSIDGTGKFWVPEHSNLSPGRQVLHHAIKLLSVTMRYMNLSEGFCRELRAGEPDLEADNAAFYVGSLWADMLPPRRFLEMGLPLAEPMRINVVNMSDEFDVFDPGFGVEYVSKYDTGGSIAWVPTVQVEGVNAFFILTPFQCGEEEFPARIVANGGTMDTLRIVRRFDRIDLSASYLNTLGLVVDGCLDQAGRLNHQIKNGLVPESYQDQIELLGRFALSTVADLAVQLLNAALNYYMGSGEDHLEGVDCCCTSRRAASWLFNVASYFGWPAAGEFSGYDYDFSMTYREWRLYLADDAPPSVPVATGLQCGGLPEVSYMIQAAVMSNIGDAGTVAWTQFFGHNSCE